jgi:hypothetical protein
MSGASAFPVEIDKYHIKNSIVKESLAGPYYQNQSIILQNKSSDNILDVKIKDGYQDSYIVYFNSTYKVNFYFTGKALSYEFFGKRYVDDDKWYSNDKSLNDVYATNYIIDYTYKYPSIRTIPDPRR